ncbi:glycine cleavage system aminomethyltransferase GcvT [Chlorobium phaeovibrioides]|uniref:Aminomethyltransferase n=1 Tax=Chlorobium phaeovibrioides TaxID=1094 RepID=A0A432ATG2_CHLPH|nr:glycine cleavage system aminomethyltransferase GcvT [Chlorobium phaeovibrioides]KAA6232111.1 glycine cleavage system aminomethyltransferase GcvT [Chlorobium phaeovibrioides]MWV54413.1 glycine cleavage system aminomethyltransferase GcvT [Chlorobium phaeovibrioides]RTY34556.1 glycine cleavage system aminomethyltransferase GcvT [Chlorobium phaeovibrioides]RTY37124.1 glycine cleavage system aminomethyltransferase GcvT [Chlorobium phaeovibrioides]
MKKTSLSSWHEKAGAKIIDFGGWLMPVQYSGIMAEHKAVRSAAGLFDVSHMGNFYVKGRRALEFLQSVTTNDLSRTVDGQAQYTIMLYENGGIVDDLIIYRIDSVTFFLIVNAGNCDKDFAWLEEHAGAFEGVQLSNHSDQLSLIALQGPKAFSILSRVIPEIDADRLPSFHFRQLPFMGAELMVARTGYTGEAGVEICLPNALAQPLWEALLDAGREDGLVPVGLGARDTLRLEMGYSLYGHEIDQDTNPLEARLKWVVSMEKGPFIGREACRQVELNPRFGVAGFSLEGRALARQGCRVFNADRQEIGKVCSGTISPTLQEPIGTASLVREYLKPGTPVFVEIRGSLQPGQIRRLPFVKPALL